MNTRPVHSRVDTPVSGRRRHLRGGRLCFGYAAQASHKLYLSALLDLSVYGEVDEAGLWAHLDDLDGGGLAAWSDDTPGVKVVEG